MEFQINYMAVVAVAIINMIVGFLWYGPLFGKPWMKLIGKTKADLQGQKDKMPMLYGSMVLGALVFAYVLAHFVQVGNAKTWIDGSMIGFWAWLGFVATTSLGSFTWSGRPLKLYTLENGFHLVTFVLGGAVLAILK